MKHFVLAHDLAIGSLVLLSDIQTYADNYSRFRSQNHEYFELTDDEKAAISE